MNHTEQDLVTEDSPRDHYKALVKRSPFYEKQVALSNTNKWHRWKAYTVADEIECMEQEYFAVRNSCGVFDVTPMSKYRIGGPDAEAFMNRLVTRDVRKIKPGRVGYTVWCNDQGKVIDDGTIFHLEQGVYLLCAQERQYDWLMLSALGFDVEISEETNNIACLAVQGPTSCATLKAMGLAGIEGMKPFGLTHFDFGGAKLMVSRTGFTGDLGYELWIDFDSAEALWDALFEAGKDRGIRAIGGDALELARIEAGFILGGVDFVPANQCVRLHHDRSPFELDLGWLVDFSKESFTGRTALLREKQEGSRYRLVKLNIEGNKPAHNAYVMNGKGGKTIGAVSSAAWSPVAKANVALASLDLTKRINDNNIWVEIFYQKELKWHRKWARAEIVKDPFWNPERKRVTPPADV
ncbi:aminomethyltransferase family protein [Biformimicrobium ophioploci]|uniref:Aminomethyltransferase family protein n=1 Tax=Biformimicrobium ophioploci TaxID=3036711 RepID=A0ABQ6M2B4_9GAMM|nr:aminomethyltransferase family protein [Microbulbifer sp. NKW57]GMG88472.1 aminomethyltransferase family protein [Microbulbifer sp. NKW57]